MKSHRSLHRRWIIYLLAVILVMPSCTRSPLITPNQPEPLSPIKIDPSPVPTFVPTLTPQPYTPTPLQSTDVPPHGQEHTQYHLNAQFNASIYTVQVSESITYPNRSGEGLSEMVLGVDANRFSNAFNLKKLSLNDKDEAGAYRLEGNILHIPLQSPLAPDQVLRLSLDYDLNLPAIPPPSDTNRPVPFGYTARQINIVDWYPYIPAYHPGEGWSIHDPWYFGEHQVYDVADFTVELTLENPPAGLVVAASDSGKQSGDTYIYHLENARSFAISASADYRVSSQKAGDVTILNYAFPFTPEAGEAALQDTTRALELYTRLFGPYPHKTLSVVEADFLDGMEYDGLYFLSRGFYNLYDGSPKGYLTAIAVHETAHQWWYAQVGNDQATEPWLDEALCTYSERLYYEHYYPELVDWWWAFRVDFYRPEGWINSGIYDYEGFRPYVNAVYLRGARFLEDLRKITGDKAFFDFLKDYLKRNDHRQATARDFFDILSKHTTADYQSLLSEYFQPSKP